MPFFFVRLLETFITTAIISVLGMTVFWWGIVPETVFCCFNVMIICLIVNLIILTKYLIRYLFSCDFYSYFKVNICVVSIFSVITTVLAYLDIEPFFTYFFLPYKILAIFGVDKALSSIAVNGIFLLVTLLVPFVVPFFVFEAPRYEEEENVIVYDD